MKDLTKKLLIILISIFVITACDNNSTEPEDDDTGGSGAITSISGTIQAWTQGEGYSVKLVVDTEAKEIFVAGESSISVSGNFNISSLEDVPGDFLAGIDSDFPEGVTCDNPNAKFSINASYLYVYDNNGTNLGELSYAGYDTQNYIMGIFVYSDSKAKITGTYTQDGMEVNVNLDFKKGWNLYYAIMSENGNSYKITLTSTHQDGLQWYFSGK